VSKTTLSGAQQIDALMENASQELVARKYFHAEAHCLQAMHHAWAIRDFERISRICMPLQECRRQKRDLAIDAGNVFTLTDRTPGEDMKLQSGCYLVQPPRVGLDGRILRELADQQQVPIIVVVREPTTRLGLIPIVALGPVTIRARIAPPPPTAPAPARPAARRTGKSKTTDPATAAAAAAAAATPPALPSPQWFLWANEQLGDAAISEVEHAARTPEQRAEGFWARLQALPDHEKLHQRLAEAALEAARNPTPRAKLPIPADEDEFGDEDAVADD
jgi:hypothetical protein